MKEFQRVAVLLTAWAAMDARGEPIVEKIDRADINWSQMTIKFYGESPANSVDPVDYKKAEAAAKQNGIDYLGKVAPTIRALNGISSPLPEGVKPSSPDAQNSGISVGSTPVKPKSLNTIYFPSGKVRVDMEAPLADMLEHPAVSFAQKSIETVPPGHSTGVIIRLSKTMKPKTLFKIVDENQAVLYDSSKVAEDAYKQHFMARFVRRPGASELANITGLNPSTIDGIPLNSNTILVSRATWEGITANSQEALKNASLAIVLP